MHRFRRSLALLRTCTLLAAGLGAAGVAIPALATETTVHLHPGQSVTAALRQLGAGGTLEVHAGSYPAFTFGPYAWSSPVTVRPAGGDTRTVTFGAITLKGVTNLRLSELRATGTVTVDGGSAIDIERSDLVGVTVKNGAADVGITDNDIVGGANGVGVTSWNGAPRPRNVVIARNRISGQTNDNIQIGIADDVTVEDNVLRDPVMNSNHNDGIQFMGGERLVVRRNRFSGQDQAMMIQPEARLGAGTRVVGVRLENNLVSRTRGAGFIVSGTVATTIVNNTVYDTPYASVHLEGANSQLRIVNNVLRNIWSGRGANAPVVEDFNCVAVGGKGMWDVKADPRFVDRVEYRLALTSPCRDLAQALTAPPDDLDRAPRGLRPDAGAREASQL